MTDPDDDRELEELTRLPRTASPPPGLEDRVVAALRDRALLRTRNGRTRGAAVARWSRLAAAVLLAALGGWTARGWSAPAPAASDGGPKREGASSAGDRRAASSCFCSPSRSPSAPPSRPRRWSPSTAPGPTTSAAGSPRRRRQARPLRPPPHQPRAGPNRRGDRAPRRPGGGILRPPRRRPRRGHGPGPNLPPPHLWWRDQRPADREHPATWPRRPLPHPGRVSGVGCAGDPEAAEGSRWVTASGLA